MTTYRDELDQTPLYGGAGTYGHAIVSVTIQGVTDGKPSSPVMPERALIDTGSTDTTIHSDLVRDLSLKQVGFSEGEDGTTGKLEPVPNYRICLTIPKLEAQWGDQGDLYAPERAPGLYEPPPFRVIIGTDILRTCRFTYNDPPGWFALEYPGQGQARE
jgi:hypothetical protein